MHYTQQSVTIGYVDDSNVPVDGVCTRVTFPELFRHRRHIIPRAEFPPIAPGMQAFHMQCRNESSNKHSIRRPLYVNE